MFLGGLFRRVIVFSVLLATAGVFFVASPVNAAINSEINLQGKLTNPDGTNVTDGNYSIRFRIYNHVSNDGAAACAANSCLWEETQGSVAVDDGIFRVALGSVTSLPGSVDFNTAPLFLGIKVSTDAEMTPRIKFTATPYAFNSDRLNGLASSAFGQLTAASQTWTGTNTFQPTTNISSMVVRQTSFGSPTANIFNLQTANSTNILQVTGPAANEAAVTLNSVGATRALTLDSASGTLVLGSNTTTLQKSGTALTVDVNNAASSTVTITNAGAGVASLSVEGNITTSATIGVASTTTFTGAGGTFSGVVAANGGITFDSASDTVGAHTLSGTVDANTNIITNLGNAGTDFLAGTGGLNLAGLLTANSGVTLGANQDLTTTAGTGTITVNSTVSNASDNAISVVPSFTGGATDALTYNALEVGAFAPTNAAGTDTVDGLNIGNMTDPGATITSTAIDIGSGWDTGLRFNDTTPTIRLGAADNTGILSVVDVNSNTLLKIQDHSTNFGASVEAGAFIGYNSMYSDEFFKDRAQVAADGNQNWGDNTEWSTGETGTCTWDGLPDAINGVSSIVASAIGSTCTLALNDLGAATPNLWLDADNLPTLLMKVRPSVAGAGVPDTDHQFFAGMSDGGFGAAPASGAPTNGIYFSNASNTAGTTGTANWYAVTDNGGASTNTACGVAVSETQFALLMIKVMSTSLVKFYIDNDVSNGVNLIECGTGNTTNINTAGMTSFLKADFDANTNASTLEVDFYRVWQDDAATGQQNASPTVSQDGQLANAGEETLGAVTGNAAKLNNNEILQKTESNNVLNYFVVSVMGAIVLISLAYRNHLAQKEIRRLSSPQYIASVIKPMITNSKNSRRKIQ
jgi:hypothetical protein